MNLLTLLTGAFEEPLHGAERVTVSFMTLGIGLVAIFAILTLLVLVLILMRYVFARKKADPEPEENIPAPAPVVEEGISEETVAAITAAITLCMAEEKREAPFRIRSVKKRI